MDIVLCLTIHSFLGKQAIFSYSPIEAEYQAISSTSRFIYLQILWDLGITHSYPNIFRHFGCSFQQRYFYFTTQIYSRNTWWCWFIWCSITRPDIVYTVLILSQFIHKPHHPHLAAALRVIRYLKQSWITITAIFTWQSWIRIAAAYVSCDSDWASCQMTQCSTTRYCTTLDNSLISWKTKKRATISRSSIEVISSTSCTLTWLFIFCEIWVLIIFIQLSYFVIIRFLCTLLQIWCFLNIQSISLCSRKDSICTLMHQVSP